MDKAEYYQRQEDLFEAHADAGYHDSLADVLNPTPARRLDFESFLKFGDFREGQKVLEMGCGNGSFTLLLLKQGCKVTAVDISAKALGVLERNAATLGVGHRLQLLHANFEDTEVRPDYDRVTCAEALHHILDIKSVVSKMAAAAKPGGLVVCLEPNGRFPLWPHYGRLNPAFLWPYETQILECTADNLTDIFARCSLTEIQILRHRLFPGNITNRWRVAIELEKLLLRSPLGKFSAFLMIRGAKGNGHVLSGK